MKRIVNILIVCLMLGVIVGGVYLANNNQDWRRGAAVSATSTSILPSTITTIAGGEFVTSLWVNTGIATDKLTGVELEVVYDPANIGFVRFEALNGYTLLNEASTMDNGQGVLTIKMVAMGAEAGGAVNVGRIVFVTKRLSAGSIVARKSVILISGQTSLWTVAKNESASYSGSVATATRAQTVTLRPTNTISPTYKITPTGLPTVTVTRTPTVTRAPTVVPSTQQGQTVVGPGVLKFRISYSGVMRGALCAQDWPVSVTVLAGNISKQYTQIRMTEVDTDSDRAVFEGKVVLNGFSEKQGFAVFVKGKKHVQTKFAVDNQNAFHNNPGGAIWVTDNEATTPVYNFSQYPISAGDVVGVGMDQDGVVDGRDFAYLKKEVALRSEGGGMLADLNGNCKLESQDLALMMVTLRDRQEQLY